MYLPPVINSKYESSWNGEGGQPYQPNQSSQLYLSRKWRGNLVQVLGFLSKRPRQLVDLQSFKTKIQILNGHYVGIKSVNIDQIRGSEGRADDFDISFYPLHGRTQSRWLSVANARLAGRELPPVELIQVGDIYFVRDGHHRISVAKALGEKYIDAAVTKWTVQTPGQGTGSELRKPTTGIAEPFTQVQ